MIFFKLDYVIEQEQARERAAAMCAAYAKPRTTAAAGETWTKLTGALKGAAHEYLTHQGWKAHEGVFAATPLGAHEARANFTLAEPRVDRVRELKKLAGVKLSRREAEIVWERLLEHKWYLGERLGRDVGMRVAAADFFENVEPPRERSKPRKAWEPLPRLPMMMPFGERG